MFLKTQKKTAKLLIKKATLPEVYQLPLFLRLQLKAGIKNLIIEIYFC